MYAVEKIGNLILITVEDDIDGEEVETIKQQLGKIAGLARDDVVVSFSLGEGALSEGGGVMVEDKINDLLRFCHHSGLRVYSYRC